MRDVADRIGWAWVVAVVPAALWLGQGGAPCPPEGPPPGQACLAVLLPPDHTLLALALLGAVGMLVGRAAARPWLSGALVASAGLVAGTWAATHRFLGGAWHVPRLPVVLLLSFPPLLVAAERCTRSLRHVDRTPDGDAASTSPVDGPAG